MKQIVIAALCVLAASTAAGDETENFLKQHWASPIPPQGNAPASYRANEASLNPDDCGACHPKQYEGWRNSLHAHAMGPGVMGQLLPARQNEASKLRDCTPCHAPLAEQETSLIKQLRRVKQNAPLHERGLICAACHVRHNVRYGPPPTTPPTAGKPPHNGFVSTPAFEDGRFCATCHQFGNDGYILNGKPLENTYAEWQASPYAKQGVQCQSCHMPQRQHLWRGIHAAGMTRSGVTISQTAPDLRDGKLTAQLTVSNSGTGHDFPTYVSPRVVVQIYQESEDNQPIPGTMQEKVIAREVTPGLEKEISDTRLPPGGKMALDYQATQRPNAAAVVMRVRVEPDYFYTGVYRTLLAEQPDARGTSLIRAALKNSMGSAYDIFMQRYPLKMK